MSSTSSTVSFACPPAEALLQARARVRALPDRLAAHLKGSEDIFLETAACLSELGERSRHMVKGSASAVALFSREGEPDPAEKLGQAAVRMGDSLRASQAASRSGGERLSRVLEAINVLPSHHADFRRIVRTLRVLTISTRVESARSGANGAGFDTVAAEVRRLADLIDTNFAIVLSSAAAAKAAAVGALAQSRQFALNQGARSAAALAQAEASLNSLRAVASSAAGVAGRTAEASGRVSGSMERILTSLQFHDITRQMIEHVVEGLEQFELEMTRGRPDAAPEIRLAEVRELCRLESTQLRKAREELETALARTGDSLDAISREVLAVVEETGAVAGGGAQGQLIETLSRDIGEAARFLLDYSAQERQTAEAMVGVARTAGEMAALVREIEHIGAEVKIIALNSVVKALRIGEEGRALGVVAQEIHGLSIEFTERTAQISSTLRGIAEEAQALGDSAQERISGSATEEKAVVFELEQMVAELRAFHGSLQTSVRDLGREGEVLSREVGDLARKLRRQAAEAESLASIEAELEAIGAGAAELAGEMQVGSLPEWLRSEADRYTMESERKIHRLVAEGAVHGAEEEETEASGELGSNIDLF